MKPLLAAIILFCTVEAFAANPTFTGTNVYTGPNTMTNPANVVSGRLTYAGGLYGQTGQNGTQTWNVGTLAGNQMNLQFGFTYQNSRFGDLGNDGGFEPGYILIQTNSSFVTSPIWIGPHSFTGEDTVLSFSTPNTGGMVIWPQSGNGLTVANSDGSSTLLRIDDGTNASSNRTYTGSVHGNFVGDGSGLTNLNVISFGRAIVTPTNSAILKYLPVIVNGTNVYDGSGASKTNWFIVIVSTNGFAN